MAKNVPAQVQARSDEADRLLAEGSAEKKVEDLGGKDVVVTEDKGKKSPDVTVVVVEDTVESLKHKLSVLQGKYNSEIKAIKDDVNLLNNLKNQVRVLNTQLQEANTKLEEANRVNRDLQAQINEKEKVVVEDVTDPLSLLSAEDRQHLEEEGFVGKTLEILGKLVKGVAKKPAGSSTDELNKIKEEVRQEMHQEIRQDKVKMFWKELTEKVPDWEPINKSEAFNTWLDAVIPYSNQTLRDALGAAQERLDHETVIQMFNDFKNAKPAETQTEEHIMRPEDQVEPDTSIGSKDHLGKDTPKGKIYTRAEVKSFYDGYTKGEWKGREKEWAAIDADIIKASAEGRIVEKL